MTEINDHDLLVRIDERLNNFISKIQEIDKGHFDHQVRLKMLEKHSSNTPGAYITNEGLLAEKWNKTSEWVDAFKRNLKWWYLLLLALITANGYRTWFTH